jgi:hypothetical protein
VIDGIQTSQELKYVAISLGAANDEPILFYKGEKAVTR